MSRTRRERHDQAGVVLFSLEPRGDPRAETASCDRTPGATADDRVAGLPRWRRRRPGRGQLRLRLSSRISTTRTATLAYRRSPGRIARSSSSTSVPIARQRVSVQYEIWISPGYRYPGQSGTGPDSTSSPSYRVRTPLSGSSIRSSVVALAISRSVASLGSTSSRRRSRRRRDLPRVGTPGRRPPRRPHRAWPGPPRPGGSAASRSPGRRAPAAAWWCSGRPGRSRRAAPGSPARKPPMAVARASTSSAPWPVPPARP